VVARCCNARRTPAIPVPGGLAPNEQPVEAHSVLAVRTDLSAKAFARGDRTGVLITWAPIDLITSSNGPANLASLSRTRKWTARPGVLQGGGQVTACWVTQAPTGWAVTRPRTPSDARGR
jgi:hypothetical protein